MLIRKDKNFWYHIGFIILYIALMITVFIFTPDVLNYDFKYDNFLWVILVFCFSILGFFLIYGKNINNKIRLSVFSFILIILYAVTVAFPEEIIFRGVIQDFLQYHLNNSFISIILSSMIFGIAHLPNGANGLSVKKWNWRFAWLTLLMGLFLGVLFYLSGSLLLPTILHALLIILFYMFVKRG